MTKDDKKIILESLNRICACVGAIASLFGDASEQVEGFEQGDGPFRPTNVGRNRTVPDVQTDVQPQPPVKPEQVRAVLAEKARTGFRAEVKALLTRYGASQLSEITDPAILAELLAAAEEIGNG